MFHNVEGPNLEGIFPKKSDGVTPGKIDTGAAFDFLQELKKQDDNCPLDTMGRLKQGWQYNPETGEYRRTPEQMGGPVIGTIDADGNFTPVKDPWINGGSSVREHAADADYDPVGGPYNPELDDYEPTFEIKDGKLVQTGKAERETIRYY